MNQFSLSNLGVVDHNQRFLDALEFVDPVIQKRSHMVTSVWRSMIPRSAFILGQGLTKKSYRFHPGVGDQRGLQNWDPIQISRVGGDNDEGFDACSYNPLITYYGFQVVNYSGYMTSRRTQHICLRDIRFIWEIRQQLGLVMSFLADITNSVWENAAREQYINFANINSQIYVLSDGMPRSTTATYDPFSVDSGDDNVLTLTSGTRISNIDWSYMRYYLRYLQMQAPQAALATDNGKPIFGIVMDLEDIDKMIENDEDLREDFRFASPEVNIQNYGMVKAFKGFSLMHDNFAPRFNIKTDDGTTLTLKRVDPLVASATSEGNRYDVNADYLNAEFAMGIIFMKKVYQFEIPPAGPSSPGGGISYGATPSLNGEFKWINIPNEETNLLGENGFYFARYEYFPKPMAYDEEAICFIYRRCPQSEYVDCEIGGTSAASSPVTTGSGTAIAGQDTLVTITANSILDIEPPQQVTIAITGGAGDGNSYTVSIGDASAAPTYILACANSTVADEIIASTSCSISW